MHLLQASITSAILISMTLAMRALTKNKLPKMTFMFLWGISVLKLLVPIPVPFFFSIYNLDLLPWVKALFNIKTLSYTSVGDIITLITLKLAGADSPSSTSPLFVAWLAGSLVLGVCFAGSLFRSQLIKNSSLPIRNNEFIETWRSKLPLRRPVRVLVSDKLMTPIATGLFRPKIILPKFIDLNDAQQLNYILTHELIHIKRFDTFWKMLLIIVLCIHWFNPAVWLLYKFACLDMELSCDDQVIKKMGPAAKKDYAMLLLDIAQLQRGLGPVSVAFIKNAAEERILAIMKFKKISVVATIAAIVIVIGITGAFGTTATNDQMGLGYSTPGAFERIVDQFADRAEGRLSHYFANSD